MTKPGSFSISETRLATAQLKSALENAQAGACVTFEGWVRDHNEGRAVVSLEYEAYTALAEQEGLRIIEEARQRFSILEAVCVHRTGHLTIGDCAVWVGVVSAHRDAAFQACRYIIDQVKSRLPIWKKEHYANGEAHWVDCRQCAHSATRHSDSASSDSVSAYYQRQMILPEIGVTGQKRLSDAKVLVIGAGGLGCAALAYLAGAGIGTIGVCEFDTLEVSNLHRQILYNLNAVGQSKAELAIQRLQALNPQVQFEAHPVRLTDENATAIFQPYDLVLDCTDNMATRLLINRTALQTGKTVIQASVYQYEGQLQLVQPGEGACLRCQWPDASVEFNGGTCAGSGVLGAVTGVLGSMQAMEAIKWMVGLPTPLAAQTLLMDLLTCQTRLIKRSRRSNCRDCNELPETDGDEKKTKKVENRTTQAIGLPLSQYVLIDVSEPHEFTPITGLTAQNRPFSRFDAEGSKLEADRPYLLFCGQGIRSGVLAELLRQQGHDQVFAMARPELLALLEQELAQQERSYASP